MGAEIQTASAAMIWVGGMVHPAASLPAVPVGSYPAGSGQSAPWTFQQSRPGNGVAEKSDERPKPTRLSDNDKAYEGGKNPKAVGSRDCLD